MSWIETKHIIRKILRNKTYSIINIVSLTIGLTCSILAFLFVQYELNVDKSFSNTEDVYRLTINNVPPAQFHIGQPPRFFDEIISNISEIQSGSRIFYDPVNLKIDDNRFNDYFLDVDSTFLKLIGLEMIVGNPDKVLLAPFTVVISESRAKQLFKDKNPIGEIIEVDNLFKYRITGIFKDIPKQSHIKSDFFASISSMQKRNDNFFMGWGNHSTAFYFKIHEGSDIDLINAKIAKIWNNSTTDINCKGDFVRARLQKFSDIYLRSGYLDKTPGKIVYVFEIAIIALLILLISCFNFINLSIAVKSRRNVETGIKKVLGANLKIFIPQILTEIFIYLSAALLISLLCVKLLLPVVSNFIDKNLELSLTDYFPLIGFIIVVCIIVALLASLFPVLQILKVNTANVLKGIVLFSSKKSTKGFSQISFRNILVVVQFTVGIMLMLCSTVVNQQLRLIRQHDLGFDKEQILVLRNNIGNSNQRFNILKNDLANNPDVKTISSASHIPAGGLTNWGGPAVAGDENNYSKQCGLVSVNNKYFETIGSEFICGLDFEQTNTSYKNKIVINEALQNELGLENPLGTKLITLRDKKEREIIGVIKDIEFLTIHSTNLPVVFFFRENGFDTFSRYIILKLQSTDLTKTIATIKEEWNRISPEYPIDYFFIDDLFNQNYKSESQTAILMNTMTMIAVLLCCLGLFGLAIFNINGRIKEIGIRKVNGAKVPEILSMLNKDFVKWVVIAFVIATPIAYYAMNKWLENFAYKTSLSWWIFALAGILALGIALLTVSWQSWRAATRNPVEALRYE